VSQDFLFLSQFIAAGIPHALQQETDKPLGASQQITFRRKQRGA
jgi:hypothetical protein